MHCISHLRARCMRSLPPPLPPSLSCHSSCPALIPGDTGAEVVAEIVKKAPRLSFFRFASTRAGPDGCMALVNAIAEGKWRRSCA